MKYLYFCIILVFWLYAVSARQAFSLPEMSEESLDCIDCHRQDNPNIYQQWQMSIHAKENIGCFECHGAERRSKGSLLHHREWIKTVVSPRDCARCHETEAAQFSRSRHATAIITANTLQNFDYRQTFSSTLTNSCHSCHGTKIKMQRDSLDATTWPNTGIGRLNLDGSQGSCSACHGRHAFSKAQAATPEACARCHSGAEHPQLEIYQSSKHHALAQFTALGCADCHIKSAPDHEATHNVSDRISWRHRFAVSIKADEDDLNSGLTAPIRWQKRRINMQKTCLNCHNTNFTRSFYEQYDASIELYNQKYGIIGEKLYKLAQSLLSEPEFNNRLAFIWYEIKNLAARQFRQGQAMNSPQVHYMGGYELEKKWTLEFIPEIKKIIEHKKALQPKECLALEQELQKAIKP